MDRTKNHEKLLKECLLLLSQNGFLAWKNSTGSIPIQNRYITFGCKGSPDILSIHHTTGVFYGFEIKSGKAVQNKHQKAFEKAVKARNGIYMVVRDIEGLKEFLSGYNKKANT